MTTIHSPKLSVVAPCYNEEESLQVLYDRVTAVCRDVVGADYEIVLVNDGSKDKTWSLIEELSQKDSHIVGVDLSRNHGHQLALTAGLNVCAGDRILVIDADLQDPPELLPDMMRMMDAGADVIYGKRRSRQGETAFKKLTAAAFYRLLRRMVDVEIPADTGDFRLMRRKVLDALNNMPERHRFIRGMVSWLGFRQEPILYDRDERFAGVTKYPLKKMIRFALDAITSFSTLPLRFASTMGLVFSFLAGVAILYSLCVWALGQTIQGWTSVMITVLLLGGLQMMLMGVMGEYLGRLYIESKQRPLFIIREIVRSNTPDPAHSERQEDA